MTMSMQQQRWRLAMVLLIIGEIGGFGVLLGLFVASQLP